VIVLGLHFGHDASIAVLADGVPRFVYEKERYVRVKHAVGLDAEDVLYVLRECGLAVEDVDYCAVTSTQNIEYVFFEPDRLSFELGENGVARLDAAYDARASAALREPLRGQMMPEFREHERGGSPSFYWQYFREYQGRDLDDASIVDPVETFALRERWSETATLPQLKESDYSDALGDAGPRSFHTPVRMRLLGRTIPGALVSHHLAHAAYAFFESDFATAGVLTHDGGYGDYLGGMFYYGSGDRIYPLAPHYLSTGVLYDEVTGFLGLVDANGKTMGLAAHGRPSLFTEDLVGNIFDRPGLEDRNPSNFAGLLFDRCREAGFDLTALADRSRMTEPVHADIAATLQLIFEKTVARAADALHGLLAHSGVPTQNLCISGGAALNCPANSLVYNEGTFDAIFVPPACTDAGLSLGSAYTVYHNLLERPRATAPRTSGSRAYLGADYPPDQVRRALDAFGETIVATRPADAALAAAAILADDGVVGWFEGRSEIGPRALGHRSIFANPTLAANWARLNRIKGRELWRPFAPIVLASEVTRWFADAPASSPYMLFNAKVLDGSVPAITHVDGTSRIQTVAPGDGAFHDVLHHFAARSGVPILLNTSFNGPSEPIVQTPEDALRFFASSDLDALFIDGWEIRRRT